MQLHNYFTSTRDYYKAVYNKADLSKDSLLRSFIKPGKQLLKKLKNLLKKIKLFLPRNIDHIKN